MAHQLERLIQAVRARPGRAILVVLAAVLVVTLWTCVGRKPNAQAPAGVQQSLVVSRQAFVISTGFRGEIAPGESIAIVAPFDGELVKLHFAYGDHVDAGQLLVELDTSDAQRARNDVEGAYLKTAMSAAQLRDWDNGPEMSRARRGFASASAELAQAERRLAESKILFDRGLIARLEYEGLQQQVRSAQGAVEDAQQQLDSTIEQGRGASRRVAMLELENATGRLSKVNAEVANARVAAPDAGIIVLPQSSEKDGAVTVGARLTKGQPIGVIAKAGALGVRFQLDEADVNRITVGQEVTVTGSGFPGQTLKGRIHSIAGQANKDSAATGKATFVAVAFLDPLTPQQARQVRIGMTADLNVVSYSNPSAITVPVPAVQAGTAGTVVLVRQGGGKPPRQVPVKLGNVGPGQVEIVSGLKPGDEIVWTETQPVPPPQ